MLLRGGGGNPNHDLSWPGGEGGKSKYDEDMGGMGNSKSDIDFGGRGIIKMTKKCFLKIWAHMVYVTNGGK